MAYLLVAISSPGYGTFTESACNGVPVLYLERDDWPETPYLVNWLKKHARGALCLSRSQLEEGKIMEDLEKVLVAPQPAIPMAKGAEQVADLLFPFVL